MRAHVILSAEKHRKCAEIVVHWRDSVFTAVAENSDINQSISTAASKVEKQVIKLKEKFHTRKRSRASVRQVAPVPGGAIEAAPPGGRIIPARRYRVKPMTPEEAALMLADSSDQFIVFRDSETNRVGVLYNRTDGNYGLIEP
jgi:putative sigma-54 modulation protein